MENRSHALLAGIFVILMIAAVIAASVWFSGGSVDRTRYVLVSEGSVSGLNPQATVRYRGVSVGKVHDIRFDPDDSRYILIQIDVDRYVQLPKGVYAQLGYQGLTGLAHVQLHNDSNQDGQLEIATDKLTRIPMRSSALDKIADSGQSLITNANEAIVRLNHLLGDENQSRFSHILKDIEGMTSNFDSITHGLQPGLKSLPELVEEANQVLKQTGKLVGELQKVTGTVRQEGGVIDSFSQSAGDFSDTIPRLRDAGDNISRSARSIDRVFQQLEERPQSLLFGRAFEPGPGEEGFVAPLQRPVK
jgi:phospholipid/cholesterol/gamma-HCH transport system substrate-binding protein